jgi:hypothetical protein
LPEANDIVVLATQVQHFKFRLPSASAAGFTFRAQEYKELSYHPMNYYQCSIDELRLEAQRRQLVPSSTRDQLSEALQKDDECRGTDATTLTTEQPSPYVACNFSLSRTAEFGQTAPIGLLVNESAYKLGVADSGIEILMMHRNRVLVGKHFLSDSPAVLRIRPFLYH